MALAGPVDAVGPVQAGVEPLRRVRRGHLRRQHVAQLVEEGLRVGVRSRSSRPSSPSRSRRRRAGRTPAWTNVSPTMRSFSGSAASASSSATERHRKDGTVSSSTFFSRAGTPALRKYFCASTSDGDLLPDRRHLDVVRLEHDRAVGIADLGRGQPELDLRVGRLTVLGVAPFDPHSLAPFGRRQASRETPANISRRRVFCRRKLSAMRPCEPGWPGALFNVPRPPGADRHRPVHGG